MTFSFTLLILQHGGNRTFTPWKENIFYNSTKLCTKIICESEINIKEKCNSLLPFKQTLDVTKKETDFGKLPKWFSKYAEIIHEGKKKLGEDVILYHYFSVHFQHK